MYHDPDRSWITDPDPNHLKGTQTNERTTVKILTSNEALLITQIVILKPPVPYDFLVSTRVSDVSVTKSCSGREVFLSFQSRMSKLACHLFTFVYRCLQGFPGLNLFLCWRVFIEMGCSHARTLCPNFSQLRISFKGKLALKIVIVN